MSALRFTMNLVHVYFSVEWRGQIMGQIIFVDVMIIITDFQLCCLIWCGLGHA